MQPADSNGKVSNNGDDDSDHAKDETSMIDGERRRSWLEGFEDRRRSAAKKPKDATMLQIGSAIHIRNDAFFCSFFFFSLQNETGSCHEY